VRLSEERIKSLQTLMRKNVGLELTNEQAQEAGMAVMRFVIAKAQREKELSKCKEHEYGQSTTTAA
jgi:hypothetical protein